jgi:hypothetical protein
MWRSTNSVSFSSLPESELDARSMIAGLISFLKATYSSWFMQLFLEEAKIRHASSKWGPKIRSAYTAEEAELDDYLEEDDEMFAAEDAYHSNPMKTLEVEINKPEVAELETFPKMYNDEDSVSTFIPSASKHPVQVSANFQPRVINLTNSVTNPESDTISKFSEAESRISSLEERFDMFDSNLCE